MRRANFFHESFVSLLMLVAFTACGCSQTEPSPPAAPPAAAETQPPAGETAAAESAAGEAPAAVTLHAVEVGGTSPAHQHGRYYLGGQPSESDLAEWKEKGVRTVVTLRTPGEIDWDEKAAVEALGMKFVSIPFRGADTLGDQQIEEALAALKDEANGPILLHCGTSNRVGAIWYAHRIRNDGVSPEDALAEARQIGLRNTSLTDVVNAYCERQTNAKN